MGYRAEKEKIEKDLRKIKIIVLCVVLALVVGLCVFSAFCPPKIWKYYVKKPKVEKREDGEMRIHFLDVGQGDCTVIELPDGKVALIDGGNATERTAEIVLRYLNALKIKTIDYLIVTHPDTDHCGSLKLVVQQKEILNAYLPATKPENEQAAYAGLYQELLEEDCNLVYSKRGKISDEDANYTLSFLYPRSKDIEEVEYYQGESSVLWLDYMGTSAIFMGDATEATEELLMTEDRVDLLEIFGVDLQSTEILKVGHHGSDSSTSLEFLQYLNVHTAVISCGKNNQYGHPTEKVLNNVENVGANLYRTDENGTVYISVKGEDGYLEVPTK